MKNISLLCKQVHKFFQKEKIIFKLKIDFKIFFDNIDFRKKNIFAHTIFLTISFISSSQIKHLFETNLRVLNFLF